MNRDEKLFWNYLRMCGQYLCGNKCPVYSAKKDDFKSCAEWMKDNFEQAADVIRQWAKEHPEKTIKRDFLEKYPNARMDGETPEVCAAALGYPVETNGGERCRSDCETCWNRPLEE